MNARDLNKNKRNIRNKNKTGIEIEIVREKEKDNEKEMKDIQVVIDTTRRIRKNIKNQTKRLLFNVKKNDSWRTALYLLLFSKYV